MVGGDVGDLHHLDGNGLHAGGRDALLVLHHYRQGKHEVRRSWWVEEDEVLNLCTDGELDVLAVKSHMPAHDLALLHDGGASVVWPTEPAPDSITTARILSIRDTGGEALHIGVGASESEEVRKSRPWDSAAATVGEGATTSSVGEEAMTSSTGEEATTSSMGEDAMTSSVRKEASSACRTEARQGRFDRGVPVTRFAFGCVLREISRGDGDDLEAVESSANAMCSEKVTRITARSICVISSNISLTLGSLSSSFFCRHVKWSCSSRAVRS
jgi:hypothetical protein